MYALNRTQYLGSWDESSRPSAMRCPMLTRTSAAYSQAYCRGLGNIFGSPVPSPTSRSYSHLSTAYSLNSKSIGGVSNRPAQWSLKHASTLASSTAVNATKEIPTKLRELYDRLTAVKDSAASYVSLSRLQLALRGLETENPVVRVASRSLSYC